MKRSQWSRKISNQQCYARVAGRNRINKERQELTAKKMEQALNMKLAGYTLKQIREALKVSRTTVYRYLNDMKEGKSFYKFSRSKIWKYPPGRYYVTKGRYKK